MDPITIIQGAAAVGGLAAQFFGNKEKNEGAQEQAAAQIEITKNEQQIEAQRMKRMELDARRQQMEVTRNAQRAHSMALTNAVSQGGESGSGLQGGFGQIAGQSGVNELGINQNLQIGRSVFAYNANISQAKIAYAQAGGKIAEGQGLTSLGGSLMSASGPLGRVGGQLFGGAGQPSPLAAWA